MTTIDDSVDKARDAARDIAWKHFDLHAKQRIEVFKSYVTLITVIFAGYGIAFQTKTHWLGVVVAVFSILISLLFWFLDRRTRELIKLSERYLKDEETRLAEILRSESIMLFTESDRLSDSSAKKGRRVSYSSIFTKFFWINIVLAALFIAVFLFNLAVS